MSRTLHLQCMSPDNERRGPSSHYRRISGKGSNRTESREWGADLRRQNNMGRLWVLAQSDGVFDYCERDLLNLDTRGTAAEFFVNHGRAFPSRRLDKRA